LLGLRERRDNSCVIVALLVAAAAAPVQALPATRSPETASLDPERRLVLAHTAGVLLGMRLGAAVLWPADYGVGALGGAPAHLRDAVSRPPVFRTDHPLLESDGDPWTINVFGHGLFGSEVYMRSRQCGGGPLEAFAWTAGAAIAWEYALEGTAKRPSAIDLAWTPIVGGLVLGELRFRAHRGLRGDNPGAVRRVLRAVVDPLGSLERAAGTRC
jgi:Domain of unknown function (DUF3943)